MKAMRTTDDLLVPAGPRAPKPRPGRGWFLAAAAFLALAVVLAGVAVTAGDDEASTTGTPTTTAPATTTSEVAITTAPPTSPASDRSAALWPVEGSGTRFSDPVGAASDFAVTFLHFTDPVVGAFRQGDARSGEVDVRPRSTGPATTILLRQLGGDDWSVLGAVTDDIEVTTPTAGTEITSPVEVAGRAVAFEGNVTVEVREDGRPDAVGGWYVTGGGDVMRPFGGEIAFAASRSTFGALVLFTASAENGQVWQAAAVRVRLRAGELDPGTCGSYRSPRYHAGGEQMEVKVFFNCDRSGAGVSLHPAYRAVRRWPAVLQSSLEALLRGPTEAERAAGLGSWFSDATAAMLREVTITDGHAVVDLEDLRPVIPNASTSAGSARLLSQLDGTVFQFVSVRSVEYRLLGSCEEFNEWLQLGGCEARTRSGAGPG